MVSPRSARIGTPSPPPTSSLVLKKGGKASESAFARLKLASSVSSSFVAFVASASSSRSRALAPASAAAGTARATTWNTTSSSASPRSGAVGGASGARVVHLRTRSPARCSSRASDAAASSFGAFQSSGDGADSRGARARTDATHRASSADSGPGARPEPRAIPRGQTPVSRAPPGGCGVTRISSAFAQSRDSEKKSNSKKAKKMKLQLYRNWRLKPHSNGIFSAFKNKRA